jgi:hypothetical protein
MNWRIAVEILRCCGIPPHADFFTLSASQVNDLLTFADDQGYRKPRNANGSRGRYWYAYLQRSARKAAA